MYRGMSLGMHTASNNTVPVPQSIFGNSIPE